LGYRFPPGDKNEPSYYNEILMRLLILMGYMDSPRSLLFVKLIGSNCGEMGLGDPDGGGGEKRNEKESEHFIKWACKEDQILVFY
jgi:hypothetical protein